MALIDSDSIGRGVFRETKIRISSMVPAAEIHLMDDLLRCKGPSWVWQGITDR